MMYGCKIMVSLTLCRFYGPPCIYTHTHPVYVTQSQQQPLNRLTSWLLLRLCDVFCPSPIGQSNNVGLGLPYRPTDMHRQQLNR